MQQQSSMRYKQNILKAIKIQSNMLKAIKIQRIAIKLMECARDWESFETSKSIPTHSVVISKILPNQQLNPFRALS